MTMINPHSGHPPATAAQAESGLTTAEVGGRTTQRAPVDPALREAFERALARQPSDGDGNDDEVQAQGAAPQTPTAGMLAAASAPRFAKVQPDTEELFFVSSQPVDAAARGAASLCADGLAAAATGARPTPAVLGAALSALTMPASSEGVQHWQFSFSQSGSAVSGVTLTAQGAAPWQVQLNVQAHATTPALARERGALDARLGELRQRLLGRGVSIGDVELHDLLDNPRQR